MVGKQSLGRWFMLNHWMNPESQHIDLTYPYTNGTYKIKLMVNHLPFSMHACGLKEPELAAAWSSGRSVAEPSSARARMSKAEFKLETPPSRKFKSGSCREKGLYNITIFIIRSCNIKIWDIRIIYCWGPQHPS